MLAKAPSIVADLLTRRWHRPAALVHPFSCQFWLGTRRFLQSLRRYVRTETVQLLPAGNLNPQVRTGVCITLVRLKREDRRERFGLVADGVCERSNSAIDKVLAEAIARAGRVHVRDDLQLVAQCDRSVV